MALTDESRRAYEVYFIHSFVSDHLLQCYAGAPMSSSCKAALTSSGVPLKAFGDEYFDVNITEGAKPHRGDGTETPEIMEVNPLIYALRLHSTSPKRLQ